MMPATVSPTTRTRDLPRRRILAISTTGGFSHAAPVLEICVVLASRGHTIEFATHDGQDVWITSNPSYSSTITKTHLLGPGVTAEQRASHAERMASLPVSQALSGPAMWTSKYMWDSFWPGTYHRLKEICTNPDRKVDFIIADFFDESAARDMSLELSIPIAILWPQMPYLLAPAAYIPGQPGFQVDLCLTSERASLWSRWRNEMAIVWAAPRFLAWKSWFTSLRRSEGALFPVQPGAGSSRPSHLVLVNSFWGLETPKGLPPLMAAVGPILSDSYPPLDERHARFLEAHERVVYVALGTVVIIPEPTFCKLLSGLLTALDRGVIDGVVWALSCKTRATFDLSHTVTHRRRRNPGRKEEEEETITVGQLLHGGVPQFLVTDYAPQRAILSHPHTRVYVTHGGGSSANEACFHGVPVLCLGFMFDQLANGLRLEEAGCGFRLDKDRFSAEEVAERVAGLVSDEDGHIGRNVERMRRIATVASRRKELAADLVEEAMYDHELRDEVGKRRRPMHLQTADMRMPWWKARNLDLALFALGTFVGMPAVAVYSVRWLLSRPVWRALLGFQNASWSLLHARH